MQIKISFLLIGLAMVISLSSSVYGAGPLGNKKAILERRLEIGISPEAGAVVKRDVHTDKKSGMKHKESYEDDGAAGGNDYNPDIECLGKPCVYRRSKEIENQWPGNDENRPSSGTLVDWSNNGQYKNDRE